MKPLLSPYILIALAFMGIADTLYLSVITFQGIAPTCLLEGCTTVLTSSYSKIFGVPLAYIGLVYYVYLLCLAALVAYDPYAKGLRAGMLLYATIGALMSVAFLYIQGVIIGAFCQYCLISAALTFVIFGTALYYVRSKRST
jgi:uncharacterized membrane protein